MSSFILAGSIQLLVGPASFSSTEQMKVRSSTRATSVGSDCARNEFGFAHVASSLEELKDIAPRGFDNVIEATGEGSGGESSGKACSKGRACAQSCPQTRG